MYSSGGIPTNLWKPKSGAWENLLQQWDFLGTAIEISGFFLPYLGRPVLVAACTPCLSDLVGFPLDMPCYTIIGAARIELLIPNAGRAGCRLLTSHILR